MGPDIGEQKIAPAPARLCNTYPASKQHSVASSISAMLTDGPRVAWPRFARQSTAMATDLDPPSIPQWGRCLSAGSSNGVVLDFVTPSAPSTSSSPSSVGDVVIGGAPSAWKRQHHGVWSHTDSSARKSPEDMAKAEFGVLLADELTQLFNSHASGPKRLRLNRVAKASVFQEAHSNGSRHFHAIVLCDFPWSPAALKRALQERHAIHVHWTSDHDYYWTNFVYLAVPSAEPTGKSSEQLDPEPWLSEGHPDVRATLEDIPRGARGADKCRVRRYLGDDPGRQSGSTCVAFTDKEFAANVVFHNLRSILSLQAWVQSQIETLAVQRESLSVGERLTAVGMQAYCYKNQKDLAKRLAFVWSMREAPRVLSLNVRLAWNFVEEALSGPCLCAGAWIPMTEELLAMQLHAFTPGFDPAEAPQPVMLKQAIRSALEFGCRKHNNVFIYGPRSSGKSHLLEPLMAIFGEAAFTRPAGKSNYPLQDLFGKKVCLLQDVRARSFGLGFDALLVWWEGKSFRVPLPQNAHCGDRSYDERAPIFATSGDKLRIPNSEALADGVDPQQQNAMMDHRFRYFHFPLGLDARQVREVAPCGHCFAKWLLSVQTKALSIQPPKARELAGFHALVAAAKIDSHVAGMLLPEVIALGALHVQELEVEDWEALPSWESLRTLEKRRLLAVALSLRLPQLSSIGA